MKRLWKNRGGFTLVEIMVTFTLTTIFLGSAAMVLSTFMRSHTVARAAATEQSVATIVMDTVTGSLGAARYSENIFSGTGNSFVVPEGEDPFDLDASESDCTLLIRKGGAEVWYVDGESGNVVKMYLEAKEDKNYLALDYYYQPDPTKTTDWEKVPWHLGEGVYQDCSIQSFTVSKMAGDNSCLNITLVIENGIAGEENSFTMRRTVECYNLASENIAVK